MASARPPSFPLRAVAALFLARQHLQEPQRRRLSGQNLARFASDTGGIQLDSINVIDRAHYLTVWSRFGPYDRRVLDRLMYEKRVLFEYWAHAACLVPTAHFNHWRRAMLDYSLRSRAWGKWLKKNEALVAQVEAEIAARGPLGNTDFKDARRRRAGGWWNWKPATHALDYLWMTGRTSIHSRVQFQKRFDLAHRVMGAAHAGEPPHAEEFRRWHLCRSLHAMGAATATDLRMYLTYPRMEMRERRAVLAEAMSAGEVIEVAVEGAPWFALAADLKALRAGAQRKSPARGTTLLSPFDSFLWHRE